MTRTMYVVYAHDSVNEVFLLRRMGERKLMVMEQYQDLVCQKCGKVNEQSALARGIQPSVVIKSVLSATSSRSGGEVEQAFGEVAD